MLNKLNKVLWAIFLFIFPFSLRFIIFEDFSYRFGNFNPFVTGFLYLPEILLATIFILWLINKYKVFSSRKKGYRPSLLWMLLILFVINIGIISLLNGELILFLFFFLRVIEAIIIYLLLVDELLPIKKVITILLSATLFQIIWGWLQWELNHSLGLTFLGESVINANTFAVAKEDISEGVKQIRPYGSFLHPNILAAYLMTILFSSIPFLKRKKLIIWIPLLTAGIYFTHSSAAMLTTLISFIAIGSFTFFTNINQKKTIVLFSVFILLIVNLWFFQNSYAVNSNNNSWQERLNQNVISLSMFHDNPLGVGVAEYTLQSEKYTPKKLLPWEFQPVHNTYLLILNESGIQGLILLLITIIIIFYKYWNTGWIAPIFALIFIAPFDHYLWDSFVGFILLALAMGIFTLTNQKK